MHDADDPGLPLWTYVWPYIDVHTHIRHTGHRAPPVGQSFEKYLARMAQTNIVAAIPSATGGGPPEHRLRDVRDQNDAIAAGCRRYPDRFPIGLALLDLTLGPAAADEIERAVTQPALVGLTCPPTSAPPTGAAPRNTGPARDAVLHPALEVVDARDGLAQLHVGTLGVAAHTAAEYAQRFRRTTFVITNVSTTEAQHRASVAAFARLENVWCDFAQHPGHPATADPPWDIADLVRGLSAGRLLFGSDAPYYDYRMLQQEIEATRIDAPRKDRIAWANAVDLIRRFRPGWTPPRTPPALPAAFAGADLWKQEPGHPERLL